MSTPRRAPIACLFVLAVSSMVAGCSQAPVHKAPPPKPVAKSPPIVAVGNYETVLSGIIQPDGLVEHLVAIRDVSPDQSGSGIDIVSASGSTAPASLTPEGPDADPYSVVVSPGAPEAVMFRTGLSPATGAGTGMYADLSQSPPTAKAIPGGTNIPGGGLFFGATGTQVLFCAQEDDSTGTCNLYWSRGFSDPVALARGCDLGTVLLSENRKVALAGVNSDPRAGTGDLIAVDMTNGSVTPIASNVALRAVAYSQTDNRVSDSPDLAFTATQDAAAVSYATTDGRVWLWTKESGVTAIAPSGRFPDVAPDGTCVAFQEQDSLSVWSSGKIIATTPSAGVLTPLFSPDSRFVAYLTSYDQRGLNALYGSALGDVSILDTGAVPPISIPWARNAAWHSTVFGPSTGRTSQVSLLADCQDVTGVVTLDGAVADLYSGSPNSRPVTAVAFGIDPYLARLPLSGGWAFMAEDPPFTAQTSSVANVWRPQDEVPRMLSETAISGTVQTGMRIPTLTPTPSPHSDEILFQGTNPIPSLQDRGFVLYGARPDGAVFQLDQGVIDASIADDGRVIAVETLPGSPMQARIHVLPFAPNPSP